MSEARLDHLLCAQDAIIPDRDITAPAQGKVRASSELRCDEQHADSIMQETLGSSGKDETKDELGRRNPRCSHELPAVPEERYYTMKTYLSGKEVDSFWGELGWALLEMMNAGLAEWTLGPALRSLTAKIQ